MEFSKQKVHDILEVVNQSLPSDISFISLFDGHAQQNGNIEELLSGLCKVFPEQFHSASISYLLEEAGMTEDELATNFPATNGLLNGGDSGDKTDPRSDEYWGFGLTELDMFKNQIDATGEHLQGICDNLDAIQKAIHIANSQDLIDGDGNIIGRDLRRILKSDLGLSELVNFAELDSYLEDCCNRLLSSELVTIGAHSSNGRTRTYCFLDSPFTLR